MNADELKTNIKRFFSNQNTMTFIIVIIAIVIVYFAYNYLVNRAISPVNIPYSTELIKEKTKITNDVIGNIKISGTFVTSSGEGLIQNRGQIMDKYVAIGYQIPPNSFFYSEQITNREEAEKAPQDDIPDGYTIYQLAVDFHSTYGCSMMPGNYIDLYFKATDDSREQKLIFDLFIKSIQIKEVLDRDGNNVFTFTEEGKKPAPAYIRFAVPLEYNKLLGRAELIPTNDIEIIPVPRNAGYSENPEETTIANEAIEQFILSKSVYLN